MSKNSALILVLSVAALISIGMVMLFSTGSYAHDAPHADAYFFIKRQGIFLGVGIVACVLATMVDYHVWEKLWLPVFILAVGMLVLCFVPHIGGKVHGSYRWLHVGSFTFQPSELGKFATVLVLAWWFNHYEQRSSQLLHGFILPLMLIGILMGLIVREEDLGATLLIGVTMITIMFVAGSNPLYMTILGLLVVGGILFLATHMSERMGRINAFMHLEENKGGKGLQQWESLKAFGSGGVSGLGLGESREKIGYLPFAHTDFIFPIIGEELGLRATLLVIFTFLAATLSGIMISMQARDRFGMLLGLGLIVNIALQAAVNIGMTTALLPNKGMPLPFISYGGSNLCLCLLFTGVLLNIYRQGVLPEPGEVTNATELQVRVTPRI